MVSLWYVKKNQSHVYQVKIVTANDGRTDTRSHSKTPGPEHVETGATLVVRLLLWFVLYVVCDSNIMWFHGGMSKRVESHVYQDTNVTPKEGSRQTRSHSKTPGHEQVETHATLAVRL